MRQLAYHALMPAPTVLQLARLIRSFHFSTLLLLAAVIAAAAPAVQAQDVRRGPDVVIIAGQDKVVYEFRQNGELRMVRVVPKWGKPYYLVPRDNTKGFGNLERSDMLLPQWIIAEF